MVKIFEQYGLMKRLIVLFKVALTHNVFITWFCLFQPFGPPPKISTSLNIAKSIAAGMPAEVNDNVAASSPLAALSMVQATKTTGIKTGLCFCMEW